VTFQATWVTRVEDVPVVSPPTCAVHGLKLAHRCEAWLAQQRGAHAVGVEEDHVPGVPIPELHQNVVDRTASHLTEVVLLLSRKNVAEVADVNSSEMMFSAA
jgi:H2-forming N5,N10-methylenetetrahydromethanopterin dehydrogenase-like enzyme